LKLFAVLELLFLAWPFIMEEQTMSLVLSDPLDYFLPSAGRMMGMEAAAPKCFVRGI